MNYFFINSIAAPQFAGLFFLHSDLLAPCEERYIYVKQR